MFNLLVTTFLAGFFLLSGSTIFDHKLPKPRTNLKLGQHPRRHLLDGVDAPELTPLYPGYGTHFSYVYVGTPPQRQSVIIDTGSHITAFPCVGCKQCGSHTDPYWDPSKSNSSIISKCGKDKCPISQSYSEGSSWQAYKVTDKLWVGGLRPNIVPDADHYAINFLFGCQTSETGLFRTQLADGIMGMSMSADTLLPQLKSQHITENTIFTLCFKTGGGIMSIGGVDQNIHTSPISYTPLLKGSSGWFTIKIIDIALRPSAKSDSKDSKEQSLGYAVAQYNTGRGVIVDSGTTDTYLSRTLAPKFKDIFKSLSHIAFDNKDITLTKDQYDMLPDIIFTVDNLDPKGDPIQLVMTPSNYAESTGKNKYAFRVYMSEGSGGVLGANFMNDKNIIFNAEENKLGFASSTCDYDTYHAPIDDPLPIFKIPTSSPTLIPPSDGSSNESVPCSFQPVSHCRAVCNQNSIDKSNDKNGKESSTHSYRSISSQSFRNLCTLKIVEKECYELCDENDVVSRGVNETCLDSPWTECSTKCKQTRTRGEYTQLPKDKKNNKNGQPSTKCNHVSEVRSCHVGSCPSNEKDFLVLADVRFYFAPGAPPNFWSHVYEDDITKALSLIFEIAEGNIDIMLNSHASTTPDNGDKASSSRSLYSSLRKWLLGYDATSTPPAPALYPSSMSASRQLDLIGKVVKLQIQIRISYRDFQSTQEFNSKVQEILHSMESSWMSKAVVTMLNEASLSLEPHLEYSRYGWMHEDTFKVIKALALPLSDDRDPVEIPFTDLPSGARTEGGYSSTTIYFLTGAVIAIFVILLVMIYMHVRLQHMYTDLQKDKQLSGIKSIQSMWTKFRKSRADKGKSTHANNGGIGLDRPIPSEEDPASSSGLLRGTGEDDNEFF